jgi:hypothetical protein
LRMQRRIPTISRDHTDGAPSTSALSFVIIKVFSFFLLGWGGSICKATLGSEIQPEQSVIYFFVRMVLVKWRELGGAIPRFAKNMEAFRI